MKNKFDYSALAEMKIVLQFLLVISTLVIFVSDSLSQTTAEKMSTSEEREIREFVDRLSTRLQITRDLAPLLNQPLARKTMDRFLANPNNPVELVKRSVARKVKRTELRQFYIAMSNITYLSHLYLYSSYSLEKTIIRDLAPEKRYPSNVVRLMKSNPIIAKWWKPAQPKEMEKIITTVEKMRSLKDTWQEASHLMRQYFIKHPPAQTKVYEENKLIVERSLKKIAVETCDSKADCETFPLHTQMITINFPALQIVLVRLKGKLEILMAGIRVD